MLDFVFILHKLAYVLHIHSVHRRWKAHQAIQLLYCVGGTKQR